MSNILIIKHGSLGDIAQASGAIQDISENHKDDKVFVLTTKPYLDLFRKNPHIHDVILDKRLSRFNLIYLYLLMRSIKRNTFTKVFDLQNSSRTSFYKKILFPNANCNIWSSSDTTLPDGQNKEEFDKLSVLDRFCHQLKASNINISNTNKPNFSWACSDITNIKSQYSLKNYILLFPFSSSHLTIKRWPYYNELITKIKKDLGDKYQIVVAPGPNEINEAQKINALCILNNGKSLDISQLSSLIKESSFVISNDTGPAHMAAHLDAKGLTLFGSHVSAKLQSIEREKFKAIQVSDLNKLSTDRVFERMLEIIS
tara:strand:- start:1938 stop:2879 length:942 start_codon:yes stop_codon:yes gene_type:complete